MLVQRTAEGSLGFSLLFDRQGTLLLVWNVIPGQPVDRWNRARPTENIQFGDRVISVNAETGTDGMMRELRESAAVALGLERAGRWRR